MVLESVLKLLASVNNANCVTIYKQLAEINLAIGEMDTLVKYSIVNESLLSLLSFNESVQSTRIEGTQVTFYNFMENLEFFINGNGENHSSVMLSKDNNREYFTYDCYPLISMAVSHAQFVSIHPF